MAALRTCDVEGVRVHFLKLGCLLVLLSSIGDHPKADSGQGRKRLRTSQVWAWETLIRVRVPQTGCPIMMWWLGLLAYLASVAGRSAPRPPIGAAFLLRTLTPIVQLHPSFILSSHFLFFTLNSPPSNSHRTYQSESCHLFLPSSISSPWGSSDITIIPTHPPYSYNLTTNHLVQYLVIPISSQCQPIHFSFSHLIHPNGNQRRRLSQSLPQIHRSSDRATKLTAMKMMSINPILSQQAIRSRPTIQCKNSSCMVGV